MKILIGRSAIYFLLLALFVIPGASTLVGQTTIVGPDGQEYNRQIYLNEDFDPPKLKWPTRNAASLNNDVIMSIEKGMYVGRKAPNSDLNWGVAEIPPLAINRAANYEIEFKFSSDPGENYSSGIELNFNKSNDQEYYSIRIGYADGQDDVAFNHLRKQNERYIQLIAKSPGIEGELIRGTKTFKEKTFAAMTNEAPWSVVQVRLFNNDLIVIVDGEELYNVRLNDRYKANGEKIQLIFKSIAPYYVSKQETKVDFITIFYLDKKIQGAVSNISAISIPKSQKKAVQYAKPAININSPNVESNTTVQTKEKSCWLKGNVISEVGVYELLINNQEVTLNSNGDFSINLLLAAGDNTVQIIATDVKGQKAEYALTIHRESKQTPSTVVIANPLLTELSANSVYHAMIIGNNHYQHENLIDLDQPISDASKLYHTLTTKYTFDPKNVTFLKDATRRDIIVAFDNLSNTLTANDNLIVFYAGHGHWDDKKEVGYWLPVDAEKGVTVDWLRNSTVQGYIESIEAKHTLLIADACFGGGIFKTRAAFEDADRSINNLYRYESRKAMTSGMLNEVPDRSVFMENLIERLNDNQEKYLSSASLFFQFRENVMNNSNNAPQFGTIHNTGDKGGDFIFILRE